MEQPPQMTEEPATTIDISKLSLAEKKRLLELLDERQRRLNQRLFFELYTDTGRTWRGNSLMNGLIQPGQFLHSRHDYLKHMEFFAQGADYLERCFMAANRCITPWTYLQTPAGEALSAEVWTSTSPRVLSWADGSRYAAPARGGFLRGIEQGFRVVLDNGQFFDCSRMHQVLNSEGWISLDRLVSLSSGLRCWHRREDYQANCAADGYLGDQPLRSVAGIDLAPLRPRGDVQQRAPLIFEHTDAVVHKLQCIRAYPQSCRLSTRGDLRRFADLFALLSGPSSAQPVLSLSEHSRAAQRLALELGPDLREGDVFRLDRCADNEFPGADLMQFHGDPYKKTGMDEKRLCGPQWYDAQGPGGSVQEWFRDAAHMPIFYPSKHPQLVGGQIIAAIVPLGLQPIIDAQVPDFHNYLAGNVVHHNCGKTFGGGGFEVSAHLTGLYPDWWEGKRFDYPIAAWAAGDTYETTRDIIQLTMLGEATWRGNRKIMDGRGIVPGYLLGEPTWRSGVQGLVDTIPVKHVSGGNSLLGLKSYDQGRKAFQGTGKHVIWLDEEPPMDVYNECLIRTATLDGIVMLTFTPLSGLSEVVLSFMPAEMRPDLADE